jgi:hypothetical protein
LRFNPYFVIPVKAGMTEEEWEEIIHHSHAGGELAAFSRLS